MKGIVFTEFLELVEDKFGIEICEQVIDESNPASGGAYTAVGSYDHTELVGMVAHLARISGVPVPDLIKTFGEHLFGRFVALYPSFFEGVTDGIHFLGNVEGFIHVEVLKLYPDAELPRIDFERDGETAILEYRSSRPFGDLAEGLIRSCLKHFGTECDVAREDLHAEEGSRVRFVLTPTGATV